MIVPDFGGCADDVALKKAIETAGSYAVKVVDLQTIVSAEHDGEDLTDAKLIELAARKLEQLSTCSGLKWDGTDDFGHRCSGSGMTHLYRILDNITNSL